MDMRWNMPFAPLIALFLVAGLVVLIVWILTRLSWKAWLSLGVTVLIVLPLLLFGAAIFIPAAARARHQAVTMTSQSGPGLVTVVEREDGAPLAAIDRPASANCPPTTKPPDPTGTPVSSAGWDPEVEHEFVADSYPSARDAVSSLVAHLARSWQQGAPVSAPSPRIRIRGFVDPSLLAAASARVTTELPGAQVDVLPNSSEPRHAETQPESAYVDVADGDLVLEIRSLDVYSRSTRAGLPNEEGGTIQVLLANRRFHRSLVTKWVDKAWLTEPHSFSAMPQHRGAHWIVGRSGSVCASPAEASAEALRDAARHIMSGMPRSGGPENVQLRASIENRLRPLIADRFAQQFERPYGAVCREAVLVEVPPSLPEQVLGNVATVHRAERVRIAARIGSALGLVLLICCVYLLVNAVTKGYYRGAFRTLAIVAVAGGLCVLLVVS